LNHTDLVKLNIAAGDMRTISGCKCETACSGLFSLFCNW